MVRSNESKLKFVQPRVGLNERDVFYDVVQSRGQSKLKFSLFISFACLKIKRFLIYRATTFKFTLTPVIPTYNTIDHRRRAFLSSTLILFCIWTRIFIQVISGLI